MVMSLSSSTHWLPLITRSKGRNHPRINSQSAVCEPAKLREMNSRCEFSLSPATSYLCSFWQNLCSSCKM